MNKTKLVFRGTICAAIAASMVLAATGCGDNTEQQNNPETRPLVLSISEPDGVFNPFFSTSAPDSSILSMTQISMLASDKTGGITCGESEPTVVKDYSVRTVTEDGKEYTYYQFIIKNGIKFSDGEPLSIKDVLFNLYVYLDPAYTGSSTIYSTDIVGLNNYRLQEEGDISSNEASAKEQEYQTAGKRRIDDLINYVYYVSSTTPNDDRNKYYNPNTDPEKAQADFEYVGEMFKKELGTDWTTYGASMDSYVKTNKFETLWQVFLAMDGGYDFYKKKADGTTLDKDADGNFIFDATTEDARDCAEDLAFYLEEKNVTESSVNYNATVREWAIDRVYSDNLGETMQGTAGSGIEGVLKYWGTASTVLTQFTADAKEDAFKQYTGNLPVPTITGITALKGAAFQSSKESSGSSYSNDYDMLQIKINGVDPKAIYNFAFPVAPLHYYSADGYVSSRTQKTVNLISEFNPAAGNFGVAFNESGFMNGVVNAPEKVGVPVGAGVYKATNANSDDNVDQGGFYSNYIAYYKRNDYFETVGENIQNAKIRLLRYQVINADQIVTSLNTRAIDFGEPSATVESQQALQSHIASTPVWTNGYGYVGINARYVPNITVRRAIMKSMNVSLVKEYYKGDFSEIIYRSMSTQSWAYPEGASTYVSVDGTSYAYDSTGNRIKEMLRSLEDQGYTLVNGIYENRNTGDKLDYKFTIAGGSQDHPAYRMFLESAELLNNLNAGIRVRVETSTKALSDLSSGKLTVWAAAWTAAIDPDMYQIYHKDSKASAIKNWGYDYIMADKETYSYEWSIVQQLSTVIGDARSTNDKDDRIDYYADALDLVMELAVELPTYQRKDLFAYNKEVINGDTLQHGDDLTPFNGPMARIWEVNYL